MSIHRLIVSTFLFSIDSYYFASRFPYIPTRNSIILLMTKSIAKVKSSYYYVFENLYLSMKRT